MFSRIITLSVALLIAISAIIPLTANYTEANARKPENHKKKYKKYKKYSKKWWIAHHNRVRKKRAVQARRRALRLRRIRLANAGKLLTQSTPQKIADTVPTIQVSNLFILVEGKIKKVFDGETVSIETNDGKGYLVRMLGIDAPRMNQDFGDKSQKKLGDLILEKNATVLIRKMDSSGRYIGVVYYGGEDINLKQIETGMAVYFHQKGYEPMSGDRKIYEQAERQAQAKRSGLWGKQKNNNVLAIQR